MLRVILLFFMMLHISLSIVYEQETDPSYWFKMSEKELHERLNRQKRAKIAKNAIIMIGDGMGVTTVSAGRVFAGQKSHKKSSGESYRTSMEQLAISGFAKTYSLDFQTTDSAASATAYLCGIKARTGTIGTDGRCLRGNCQSCTRETHVDSILKRAHQTGKWTGIVTNTRVTHASPAGAYAHIPDRYWETYDGYKFNKSHFDQGCRDIADQLIRNGDFLNVVFGGGLSMFLPNSTNTNGKRIDNVDLIKLWIDKRKQQYGQNSNLFKFVKTLKDFNALKPPLNHVLGLFSNSHMYFSDERMNQPSLASMTQKAIEILSKNPLGFVLFVEGGLIDVAHHKSQVGRALDEFVNFDEAVNRVTSLVDLSDTSLVVSADHSHMFSIGANSFRNSDVLGYAINNKINVSDIDNMPVFILAYGNGPGYLHTKKRQSANYWLEWNKNRSTKMKSRRLQYPSVLPLSAETHGAEDVPVYADGPNSNLLTGTFEQNFIANAIAYSACLFPFNKTDRCQDD